MKQFIQIFGILIVLIFIGSCKDDEENKDLVNEAIDGVGFVETSDALVSDDVVVISSETNELILETVSENELVFNTGNDQIQNTVPGTILLAGASENNPNGYARKVVSVTQEGSNIKVETDYAKLNECYDELEISSKIEITPESEFITYDYDGNEISKKLGAYKGDYEASYDGNTNTISFNTVVFDADKNFSTTWDQVKYKGSLQIVENDFTFDLKLDESGNLKVFTGGFMQFKIVNAFEIKAALKFDRKICIGRFPIPIPSPTTFVFTPYISLYVGASGEVSAEISVKNTTTLTFGAIINNNNSENKIKCTSSNIKAKNKLEISDPKYKLEAKAYISPAVEILFMQYPDAKVSLAAKGYVFFDVETDRTPLWRLGYGVEALAQAKLKVMGDIVDLEAEYTFYGFEEYLKEGGVALKVIPPVLKYPFASSIDVERNLFLRWENHEDQTNQSVKYNVYLDESPEPTTIVASDITNSFLLITLDKISTYYWKIEIIDDQGNKEMSQISSFKTANENLAPDAFELIYPQHDMTDVTSTLFSWNAATDPDEDNLYYSVRVLDLAGNNSVVFVQTDITETEIEVSGLKDNTRYNVDVTCFDEMGNNTAAHAVFYTGIIEEVTNNAPPAPILSFPENNAVNQDVNFDFSWDASTDADGDQVVYDFYLDTDGTLASVFSSDNIFTTFAFTGLINNTTYYWKIVAKDGNGGATESETWSFTTKAMAGTTIITTDAISSITESTAISGGNITGDGGASITARGVCWSINSNPTILDNFTNDGSGTGIFTSSLTGLVANTSYNVCAYATNSQGTEYGDELNFTTTQSVGLPTLTTDAISNIAETTATGGGNISNDGGKTITERGVCWSTNSNPTISDNYTNDGSGTGVFSSSITELTAGTIYNVRAYATNSDGIFYGNEQSFTTSQSVGIPTLKTRDVRDITVTSAKCYGDISSDGGFAITTKGICWSTSDNPTLADNYTNDGEGNGTIVRILKWLTRNTTYYIRAYATNSQGTAYGNVLSFTTTGGALQIGSVTDYDGNIYQTVKIGEQWWMAENLKVTHYNDGTEILLVEDRESWSKLITPAYCWYNNNRSQGVLYNWYVTETNKVCPAGWHAANYDDWFNIERYLRTNGYNYDGSSYFSYIAKSMASTTGWDEAEYDGQVGYNPNYNNSTGFNGLATGWRKETGSFGSYGGAYLWLSKEYSSSYGYFLYFNNLSTGIQSIRNDKKRGYSVRCVKD